MRESLLHKKYGKMTEDSQNKFETYNKFMPSSLRSSPDVSFKKDPYLRSVKDWKSSTMIPKLRTTASLRELMPMPNDLGCGKQYNMLIPKFKS